MLVKTIKKWYLKRLVFLTKLELAALRQQREDSMNYANNIRNDMEDRILAVDAASNKKLKITKTVQYLENIKDELRQLIR